MLINLANVAKIHTFCLANSLDSPMATKYMANHNGNLVFPFIPPPNDRLSQGMCSKI